MSPTPYEPEFVPIAPNPYIVGNPVRSPDMFFGRESEFELVRKRFKHADRGSLLVFCGERRSGKTSILMQIQQGRLGPEFIPVLIDMQAMAVSDQTEFLSLIAQEIVEQLAGTGAGIALPDFTHGNPSGTFRNLIESILERHPHRKLLLLFDEYELFEDKLDSGVLTKDVLLILSNLMENLPTFLVFTGSHHLEERRKEYWHILEKAHEYRRISYLQTSDAIRLIQEPVAGRATYASPTVQQILRLTAGHPFFTQAVCQNLVDALNEERKTTVTSEILNSVVEMIIEHPFPQMTFLWDTLEREEKLTLSLLAETLQGPEDHATVEDLMETSRKGKYPLHLSRPSASAAVETLFKQEILTKRDGHSPAYAFRMDLWRLWIQRMLSVWQVMQEEGMDFRSPPRGRRRLAAVALAVAGILAVTLFLWPRGRRSGSVPPADHDAIGGVPVAEGWVSLVVQPADARIELEGAPVAVGRYAHRLPAGHDHPFTLSAPGYRDSTLVVRVSDTDSLVLAVSLWPRRGGIRVETEPPAAEIWLDGERIGSGRTERLGLAVPEEHTIEVRGDNYRPEKRTFLVQADTTILVSVHLQTATRDLNLLTVPDGAVIDLDGQKLGASPLVLSALALGPHRLRAELAGYVSLDTTLAVDPSMHSLRLTLVPVPPGTLVVSGDSPARIYIDEQQIGSGELPSSGERTVSAGSHTVEVVFRDGATSKIDVEVAPGDRVQLLWEAQKLRVIHHER